jgi:hypothetical protein
MAVSTTPQAILNAAYAKSTKNRPGTIATESTELLELVIRSLRGIYAAAARVNPLFFAEQATVAFASTAWPRPETAESIFRIQRLAGTTGGTGSAGDEVVVVPFDDRAAESGKGAVYRFGQKFFAAGNAADPTGGDLAFFYAKRPTSPASLTATLDALWAEQFNELLVLEVALYLANKDGRAEELGALDKDRMAWLGLFVSFLEHETANERRRFGHIQRINTASLVPMLAPGRAG